MFFGANKHNPYSVETGFGYAVFKLSFSKQCKLYCFNPLCKAWSTGGAVRCPLILYKCFSCRTCHMTQCLHSSVPTPLFIWSMDVWTYWWSSPCDYDHPRSSSLVHIYLEHKIKRILALSLDWKVNLKLTYSASDFKRFFTIVFKPFKPRTRRGHRGMHSPTRLKMLLTWHLISLKIVIKSIFVLHIT